MDGENNGKPVIKMDDLGGPPLFLETPIYTTWKGSMAQLPCIMYCFIMALYEIRHLTWE